MNSKDWLVGDNGNCQACKSPREWDLLRENYRLYRFLTEVEDALNEVEDEVTQLPQIRLLVRRLITNSYWVQSQYLEPSPTTGVSVLMLYDELGFPLTVQTVTFAPGTISTIHNHGTWGVVAVLKGQEKNTFWQRIPESEFPDKIKPVDELILSPGDIISLSPNAIHSVEAVGDKPTVTFNIYGETYHSQRFEFDTITHTAKNF
ncbi:MAG: cupin [Nostocaceae cyanobacterium]|nr:cupin [Nostocaceae cyanobacterium]